MTAPTQTTTAEVSPCGTPAGYARHRSYGEPTCDACRRANADRIAAIRATRGRSNPDRERRWRTARGRAVEQLAREYPDRYRELLHHHLCTLTGHPATGPDATPGVYQLPAEPPASVTALWDCDGDRWDRYDVRGGWSADGGDSIWPWPEPVVEAGPLSTNPPAGTEATDADQG